MNGDDARAYLIQWTATLPMHAKLKERWQGEIAQYDDEKAINIATNVARFTDAMLVQAFEEWCQEVVGIELAVSTSKTYLN